MLVGRINLMFGDQTTFIELEVVVAKMVLTFMVCNEMYVHVHTPLHYLPR